MLRPVPKFGGTSVRDPQRVAATASTRSMPPPTPTTGQLRWRTSGEIAPSRPSLPAPEPVTLRSAATDPAVVQAHSEPADSVPVNPIRSAAADSNRVSRVQFELPQPDAERPNDASAAAPQDTAGEQQPALPPALRSPAEQSQPLPDFFADPFDDLSPPQPESAAPQSPRQTPPATDADLTDPLPLPLPNEPQAAPEETDTRPVDPREEGSLRRELEDFEMPRRSDDRRPAPLMDRDYGDVNLVKPAAFSCDDFRGSIAAATIQKVSLDISPPFRPDVIELDEYERIKRRFDEQQVVRDWQSIDGRKLGRGRMRNLAYEKVVIETEFGTLEELPINRISEADLAYVSAQWGLPQECLIEQPRYQPRRWTEASITWKASNLMHKPLYFEEVNLERYGHTAGPWLQPVVSSAHFFANIAVMPYKMGVHLPGECQYALGYYRPGNCAPWITPPIPLSLRGALFQAGAVSGTAWVIP